MINRLCRSRSRSTGFTGARSPGKFRSVVSGQVWKRRHVLGLLLLILCSHDWARRSWFKQGYPQTCSELQIMKMSSFSMVNVGSRLRLQRCRPKTIAEPSSTLGRPISRIARFKLSCRSWTKIFWVFRYQCKFGAESSTARTFWRVAARLKGPKTQTATAYTCQPGCSHGSDVRSNWHTLPMKNYIKDLDLIFPSSLQIINLE